MKLFGITLMSCLVAAYVGSVGLSYERLSVQGQAATVGAECNHQDSDLWCTTGTATCEGECETEGYDCSASESTQIKANSGSIYRCVDSGTENDIHCYPIEGDQSCEQTTACRCRSLPSGKVCESVNLANPTETTKSNVTTTTDC